MEPGFSVNPVFETASAYLKAAEALFANECKEDRKWLYVPNWFVVHHLSVISTELFLKSFRVTVSHGHATDISGPHDAVYQHAFNGHKPNLEALPHTVSSDLKDHLSEDSFTLMQTLSNEEIARGRYPYENVGGENRFPNSSIGRDHATAWMKLAKELKGYGHDGKPTPEVS